MDKKTGTKKKVATKQFLKLTPSAKKGKKAGPREGEVELQVLLK